MNQKNFSNDNESEDNVFEDSRIARGRKNRNPYISSMKEDRLYHIGLVAGTQNMKEMFGDVKVGLFWYIFTLVLVISLIRSLK